MRRLIVALISAALLLCVASPAHAAGWTRTYLQGFDAPAALGEVGDVYGAEMRGYDGCCDSSKKGTYAPDRVLSVVDGHLRYDLHTENGRPLVAAPQPLGYAGQKFGRFTVVWRTNVASDYAVAFLLWPTSESWDDGEVDWPEVHGLGGRPRPASVVPGTVRGACQCPTWSPSVLRPALTDTTAWHRDVITWAPTYVAWHRDGVELGRTATAVPKTTFRWSLQAETNPEKATVDPKQSGVVEIDWLKVEAYG